MTVLPAKLSVGEESCFYSQAKAGMAAAVKRCTINMILV